MDVSDSVATWLSLAVTTIGLGGLIEQASAINDRMDPFHATRTVEYLGIWIQRQQRFPWWKIAKPPPLGPVIRANMSEGFCKANVLHVTRIPIFPPGKAGWSLLLSMFHTEAPSPLTPRNHESAERGPVQPRTSDHDIHPNWECLERRSLTRHGPDACIIINRVTLITILIITNARPVFQFSDAPGFRAGYASYCGQWCTYTIFLLPCTYTTPVKHGALDKSSRTKYTPRKFAISLGPFSNSAT